MGPLPRLISISLFWLSLVPSGIAQNSLQDILTAPGLDLRDERQRQDTVARMGALMAGKLQAARAKALLLGLAVRTVHADGRIMEIVDFVGDKPQYFTTTNQRAGISTGANLLQVAPYNVTGSGLTVGVWDGGGVRTTHQELTGRVTIKDGAALADHSTHVAGTIGATGVDAAALGDGSSG